jgi:hypothetical protein
MAGKGRRRLATPESAAANELRYATVMGAEEAAHRLAFHRAMVPLDRGGVDSWRTIRALASTRGERWTGTYYLRKAERRLAADEAVVAALTAWLAEQGSGVAAGLEPGYDAPAGAGDAIEAYRG